MTSVHHSAVASETDVEPLVRAARAEVARLSLAVRSARHEAELREREAVDLDRRARDAERLLKQSLTEAIQDHRRSRSREHADNRASLPVDVPEAELDAGWGAALALKAALAASSSTVPLEEQHGVAPPAPPLRLRIVGADDVGEPDAPPDLLVGETEPVAPDEPDETPVVDAAQPTATPEESSAVAVIAPDQLRELVRDAVLVGVRDAIEQARATMLLFPALARPAAAAVRPAPEVADERPLLRRLLYLDVLLPLVAAVLVLVLFVAWVA